MILAFPELIIWKAVYKHKIHTQVIGLMVNWRGKFCELEGATAEGRRVALTAKDRRSPTQPLLR